jgi:type IV secretory pathway protease TraF
MRDANGNSSSQGPIDGRIVAYRAVKWFVLVAGAAVLVKLFCFDTFLIRTDQMAPALTDGDRVLVLRFFSIPPMSWVFSPARKSPVIIDNRRLFNNPACLRVAARSGDSVCVSRGRIIVVNRPSVTFSSKAPYEDYLPPDYSPRDSMPLYVMPQKGDAVLLDSLASRSARDFFFAASLIRQENPGRCYSVKPALFLDGAPADSFTLSDFYLYKGKIGSVPAQHEFDWFFWDRVRDYCVHSFPGKEVFLSFSLVEEDVKLYRYVFTKSCIFLCADDWEKGFDSRFFGPLVSSCVKGRVACVLWSNGRDPDGSRHFRIGRLFKIIR